MVNKDSSSATPASLRRTHRGLVLSRIQAQPGVSRAELARAFGFSEMAATRIARDLLEAGIVAEIDVAQPETKKPRRIGRPKIGLCVTPDGVFAAGITVSAYHSEVSICDANGTTVARKDVDNASFKDVANTARLYSGALLSLIADAGINKDRIVGVGVALSAKTAPDVGLGLRSEVFGWEEDGGTFWTEIRQSTGLPVVVENIANALALSEMRFGVAKDLSEFALVHVATLVGVGAVSDREIIRGSFGNAGRIGHFRSTETPLRCTCGRNDCVNLSATGFGILGKVGLLDDGAFDPSKLPFYAKSLVSVLCDPAHAAHLRAAGTELAAALDPVAKLLAPQKIVISGILGAREAYFQGVAQEMAASFAYKPASGFELVRGDIAPSDAACLLALHMFCYSDQLDFERFRQPPDADQRTQSHA